MKKKLNLTTRGPDSKVDPLSPEFENKDDKQSKKEEFPSIPYFQLYRYGTALDKLMIFIGVLSAIGTAVCQPLNMLIFGDLTGNMITYATSLYIATTDKEKEAAADKLEEDIMWFAIYNSAIGIAMLVLSYLSTLMFNYSGIRQSFRIRSLYLQKVLNQDVGWYDVHQSGDFASRMGDDLLKLEEGIGEKVVMFLHFQLSFIGCLVLALIKGWELALICLISLPVTMISMGIVAYLTSKLAKNELEAYGSAGTIAEEVLTIIRTVLAFGGQQKEKERYEKHLTFARDNNILRSLLTGIGFGILWFCIYASYALAFWYGVGLILDEKKLDPNDRIYTPGNMVTVFFSVMTGSMNFGMSSPYIEVFGVARGAAAKIFGVIDAIPKIHSCKGKGLQPEKFEGNIVFENVRFNYPSRPDVNILQGLNLTIKAGETVALVGSSGCGKSTCIQLIQRFYDPDVGTVYLDGNDITTLDLSLLRSNIGVVGQEPVLFGTTIAENIRYGYKWATMENIENAAKKANAHKFISALPEGYNTLVGERGAQLSGGQKQRIAIARALVRDPSILLLDEATSALDTNSESKVQAALDNASKDCTTIIIAHRLSTIRGANRIVVIKEGQAVEDGTHQDLMNMKGEYYNLVMNQVTHMDNEGGDEQVQAIDNVDDDEDIIAPDQQSHHSVEVDDETGNEISLMKVLRLNKPEWVLITIGVVASAFMGFAMPIFAVLFGDIIGVLDDPDDKYVREETNMYCIYFVVAGVGSGIATFFQIYMFGNAGEKLVMRVRSQMFEAMLNQEIGWYDRKENGVGALCAKLSSEAANIQGATGQRIGTIFQSLATLGLSLALSMYYEWRLGLLALAFAPLILAAVYLQQKMMKNETTGYRKSLENSTKLAVEAVSNIRTVASLGNESTFHGKYVEELLPYIKKAKRNTHYRAAVIGVARSIMFFAFAACMFYGGYLIREDNLDFSKVLKVTQSLIMGTVTIANALAFTPNFHKGLMAASKVFKLLERQPKVRDPAVPEIIENIGGDINYSSIEFTYPTRPDTQILKGLDLLIERGKTIALVGPSGCGKSTIIQLIERFYDPKSGIVSLNDKDIKTLKLVDLRSHLGIVSQEPNLFDRTIGENIAYGDNSRQVTEAEYIEAAKEANIHTFIAGLPLGYNTPLGDKGAQLSGGQKQRVAIARALVRNPQILLLDEATSALDTESEKIVQEALDKAKQGRTCITIAHRLSTIQNADVICVINEGKVLEMGTHTQLLAQKGMYHHLYSLQNGSKR